MNLPQNPHQWSRRHLLQFLGYGAGAFLLQACQPSIRSSQTSDHQQQMALSLGIVSWIGLTPLFIAQKKGFFQEQNLQVDVKTFGTNTDLNAAFLAGQLDGNSPVTSEAVLLASKGKDFRIVLVQDNSVGGDGILARNKIKSIADFKGKKIAVEIGAVSHAFLLQILKEAGLSPSDVTLVNTDPASGAAAYQAGNIDIVVTYAPFLAQANHAQKDGRIIYDSTKMPTAITDLYVFSTEFIKTHPQAVTAFVKGIFKGIKFLEDQPQVALAIAAKELQTKPEDLATDLKGIRLPDPNTNLKMLGDPQSKLYLLNSLNAIGEFLISQKQVEKLPDLSQLLDPQFVKASISS